MLKLALRNIFRQRGRTAMTLGAIIFGVAGLVLSGGFLEAMLVQLAESIIHSRSGHIQITRKGFFESGSLSPEKYLIETPGPLRKTATSMPGVEDVMARVSFTGLLNNGRTDRSIIGEGIEPGREGKLGSFLRITAGRQLTDEDRYGVILGEGVASALKLQPGGRVTLVANSSGGALNTLELDVVGVFQSFSKEFDARAIRMPLAAARELLATTSVNTLVLSLARTSETDRTAGALAQTLDPAVYEVKTWYEINDFFGKTVALFKRQFGVLLVIILLMVLLSVANSVNMTTFERVSEFGTMMAFGNRRRQVFLLILAENVVLGFIGAAAGIVLGVFLAWVISAIGIPMPPPPNSNLGYTARIRVVPGQLGVAFAVGWIATMGASLLPARRITRIPVIDALRQNV
jgi:putative ABC transport system permease protein